MPTTLRLTLTALSVATAVSCTAIADFGQYQAGPASGGEAAVGGTGGTGGGLTDGGAGGSGGDTTTGGTGGMGGEENACDAVDSYTWTTTETVPIQDACVLAGQHVVIPGGSDEVEREPTFEPAVPFPFCFYGKAIEGIWVGDNGYVGFGVNPPNALLTQVGDSHPLGEPGLPDPGLLPFWDALRVGAPGVCAAVTEQEPFRILWITWKEACFDQGVACNGSSELTFSIGIEETSNKIFMGYVTMSGSAGVLSERASGQTATIGITNDVPPGCSATECGTDGRCGGGEACGYTQFSAQALTTLDTLEFSPN